MKTLKLFAMLCTTLLLCNSCLKGIGWEEEQRENNKEPEKPQTGLVLTATPSTITADGEDVAILEVTLDGEVIEQGFTLYDDEDNIVELENMEFSTTVAGEYKFWAAYKAYNSETITITAEEPTTDGPDNPDEPEGPTDEDPENLNFKRRVLLTQITGTGCGYCPGMVSALEEVMQSKTFANNTVLAVAHRYNSSDPAYLTNALDVALGVSGAPWLNADMCYTYGLYSNMVEVIHKMVDASFERTTTKAGISAVSYIEDDKVVVKATVKAAEESHFRIGAWLMEDGIYGQQTNYGFEGEFNTHDNCIRVADSKVSSSDYTGYEIGPVDEDGKVQPIKKGETAEYTFTIELKDKWKRENCSLVLFVTAPEKLQGRESYFVNNVIEMPLEGEVAFEYEDDTEDEE
jgi:hypothetical protein